MLEIKAALQRKDAEIDTTNCMVDKVIRLSGSEFDLFSRNLLRDWDFIQDNPIDTVVDEHGWHHCLLVLGEGRREGILVNAEGGSYARYSAHLPNAADLLTMDQYPSLAKSVRDMAAAAEYVVGMAAAEWPDGKEPEHPDSFAVSFYHLNSKYNLSFGGEDDYALAQIFCRMLHDRPEIRRATINAEEFLIDAEPREAMIDSKAQNMETALDGNMDAWIENRFAQWENELDSIPGNWCEDRRYRQHKDGALYYLGGETGQYMRITNEGQLTVGSYELARPGIEDAILSASAWKQYQSYEHALLEASRLAGQRFRSDLFQQKPSVLEQIREAKKAPPTPHKPKDAQHKDWPEL